MTTKLTQAIVHELLLYDPYTGVMVWRRRDRRWFKTDREWRIWNTKYKGKPAFTSPTGSGHLEGRIFNRGYLAHRVILFWMTGRWPDPQIDHRNRDGLDNRWTNLREATQSTNMRNVSLSTRNTSGRIGVRRSKSGRWCAQMRVGGVSLKLGVFDTFDEACLARKAAEREHGFAPGHGRARLMVVQ